MRDTVLEVLTHHFGDKTLEDNTNLVDELNADEYDLVEVSIILDEKLNISLDEEAILDIKTVGDLIKLVESNVQST
jgi:acyl carrier protein|tara:strand:- start:265 stop:492 length:228 start_codon:yes stop_codon:yes gene_type:complete